MLEIEKYKNESQEEKIKSLAMEIDSLKRHSYEHMMTNRSLQSYGMNNQMMGYNQIDNIAYNTQRLMTENRMNDNTSQAQMMQSIEQSSGSNNQIYNQNRDRNIAPQCDNSNTDDDLGRITMNQTNSDRLETNVPTKQSSGTKNTKELENINHKLSQQIKDNLKMFENLNKQLNIKNTTIHNNEKEIADNKSKVNVLMQKLKVNQ